MAGEVVKTGMTPSLTQANHANAVFVPQSCTDLSSKVANIQRSIAALDDRFETAMEINRDLMFANRGIVVFGLIKDTCVAFLDLSKELVGMLPGGQGAARVADAGLKAIAVTDTTMQYAHGQITSGQAAQQYGSTAADMLPGDNVLQASWKFLAGQVADVWGMIIEDKHKSAADKRRDGLRYASKTMIDTADVLKVAAEAADEPWAKGLGRTLGGLKVIMSIENTHHAVEARLDGYLDEKVRLEMAMADAKFQYTRTMRELKARLEAALAELRTCQQEASAMSTLA